MSFAFRTFSIPVTAVTVLALGGCGHSKDPKAQVGSGSATGSAGASPSGPGSASTTGSLAMFTEAEIAAYKADLVARLDANAKRACPGPALLGAVTPGPSDPALVALFEASGDLVPCLTQLAAIGAKGDLRTAIEPGTPEVVAFDKACGPKLAEAVHAASAHEGGCSPYQIGVRPEPTLIRAMHVAFMLGFRARVLADGGEHAKALAVVLDGLRMYQDLERGHVTLVAAMIAAVSIDVLAARADLVLASANLPPDQLAALGAALDRLLAATPTFADVLAGERENMDTYFAMGPLDPTWSPPGGWNPEMKRDPKPAAPTTQMVNPRDEAAVMFATTVELAKDSVRACAPGATLSACRTGFEAQSQSAAANPASDASELGALYAKLTTEALAGTTDRDAVRLGVRTSVVDILRQIAQPGYEKYAGKFAGQIVRLAELRLRVEVLRSGKCPTAAELTAPPFATLRAPAALGEPLELAVTVGNLTVTPPTWTVKTPTTWTIRCAR